MIRFDKRTGFWQDTATGYFYLEEGDVNAEGGIAYVETISGIKPAWTVDTTIYNTNIAPEPLDTNSLLGL